MLSTILTEHWRVFLAVYGLTSLASAVGALYPLATGWAINGVLAGNYHAIAWLVACHFLMMVLEVSSKKLDTRVFTRIYAQFVSKLASEDHRQGLVPTRIAARASMARDYIEFFEKDIPQALFGLGGTLVALAALLWLDPMIGLLCIGLLAPLTLIGWWLAKRSTSINRRLNDQLEREVDVLQQGRNQSITRHFRVLSGWRVRLSDVEANAFGAMEMIVIILFVVALLRLSATGDMQAGDIYAIFAYIWRFVFGLDVVPVVIQRLSKIADLDERFRTVEAK